MTMPTPVTFRRLALLCAVVLPFTLTACDTADTNGDENFFLPARPVEFDFTFDGGALDAGLFNDVESDNTEDLVAFIEERGFTVDDVVGVTVGTSGAELRIAQPPLGAGVNGFDRVQVSVRPEGATTTGTFVASGSDFTSTDDTVDLDIDDEDFALTIQTGAFEALLQVDPSDQILDATYVVEVSFDVVVEVRGAANRPVR